MARSKTMPKYGPTLPQWTRGREIVDASHPLGLVVRQTDIDEAVQAKASNDGSACVMAQSCQRLGFEQAYFYKTVAYVDWGDGGAIERFRIPPDVRKNVIDPFDRRQVKKIVPGRYDLRPPKAGDRLGTKKITTGTGARGLGRSNPSTVDIGRLVRASQV